MGTPDDWTDDMRVSLAPGKTVAGLVSAIMDAMAAGKTAMVLAPMLASEFGMTMEDAYLALDRVPGGIVRALTGNPENRPDGAKDPLAYESFERVWETLPLVDPSSSRRKAAGPWKDWLEKSMGRPMTP